MSERPIIFSAPMVRALLDGRKTQTRRVLRPQPFPDTEKINADYNSRNNRARISPPFRRGGYHDGEINLDRVYAASPDRATDNFAMFSAPAVGGGAIVEDLVPIRYAVGDRLWVREALSRTLDGEWRYRADQVMVAMRSDDPRVPAMIAWAHHKKGDACSPIHMPRWASRLTLTVTAVRVERLQDISEADAEAEGVVVEGPNVGRRLYRHGYRLLWGSLHGPRAWDANPWVAAISFSIERAAP